ncbi:breast cancer type 1 susceptibility protein homolog isoform X2 [Biomphalaria glabrata]|uniref:RING-type E3 ubiquitin transferase BRCA1 n=1 Tax=Biomphalaria glabrata TaxID=6526 RepID=A0A9W2ZCR9_BIOGL|nr:breast cancer type 1 susceptibility protein homolog isoform X2 [Biomphalaria glabrata]
MDPENNMKEIVSHMQKSLECSICLDLLNNPVSTKCDHQFCSFCIYKFLQNKRYVPCPLCKKPITKRGLQERTDLTGVIAHVKKLITAFEADTGEKIQPGVSPTPLKDLKASTKDNNDQNKESASADLSNENNCSKVITNVECVQHKRISRSRAKCRVTKRPVSPQVLLVDVVLASDERLGNSEPKNITSNVQHGQEEQSVGNLLQYLENGACGEKVMSTRAAAKKHNSRNSPTVDESVIEKNASVNDKKIKHKQKESDILFIEKSNFLSKDNNGFQETLQGEKSALKNGTFDSTNKISTRSSTRNAPPKNGNVSLATKKEESEAGEVLCSSSSSAASQSSTQLLMKPIPVVSRTYSKGMQNLFQSEGSVRNWVETLPKIDSKDLNVEKEIKLLTTKDKINLKKSGNIKLFNNNINSLSKTCDDNNFVMENKMEGTNVLEPQVTPRPRRSIFKCHSNDKVLNKNIESKDPFEFTSSQTLDKDSCQTTRKRKINKCDAKTKKVEKLVPLHLISAPISKSLCDQATCQVGSQETKTVHEQKSSIQKEAEVTLTLKTGDIATDISGIRNAQTICHSSADAVQNQHIHNEPIREDECTDLNVILATNKHNISEPALDDKHTNSNIMPLSNSTGEQSVQVNIATIRKIRTAKKRVQLQKKRKVIEKEDNVLSQKSGSEMEKLINKISQAEDHELLFSTQDVHKKMEESNCTYQSEINDLKNAESKSLICDGDFSESYNTDTISDSLTVPVFVGQQKYGKIPTVCDSDNVSNLEKICETQCSVNSINQSTATREIQNKVHVEHGTLNKKIKKSSFSQINHLPASENSQIISLSKNAISTKNLPEKPKTTVAKNLLQNSKTSSSESLQENVMVSSVKALDENLLENLKNPLDETLSKVTQTPEPKTLSVSLSKPQTGNISTKNSDTLQIKTMLPNLPVNRDVTDSPKTPQNKLLSQNLWTSPGKQKLFDSDTPQSKHINRRSLSLKFPIPNVKEMIQVSPGPKGFVPVHHSLTASVISSSDDLGVLDDDHESTISSHKINVSVVDNVISKSNVDAQDNAMNVEDLNHDSVNSASKKKKSNFLLPEYSPTANDVVESIPVVLVTDTLMDISPTKVAGQTQLTTVIHDTLDNDHITNLNDGQVTANTEQWSLMADKETAATHILQSVDSDVVGQNHLGVNFIPGETECIAITDKPYQSTVNEIYRDSLSSTLCQEKEFSASISRTEAYSQNKETVDVAKAMDHSPNVYDDVSRGDKLLSETPQETPSTISQSILHVNLNPIRGTIDNTVPFLESESNSAGKQLFSNQRNDFNDCISETEPFTQVSLSKCQKHLSPDVINHDRKHTFYSEKHSQYKSVNRTAQLSKTPLDLSVNSAPGRFDLTDNKDENNMLLVRRSKRRCLSLDNTPLKPIVFVDKQKVDEAEELIGETEAVEALVNCTEGEKPVGSSPETAVSMGSLLEDIEVDLPIAHHEPQSENVESSVKPAETCLLSVKPNSFNIATSSKLQKDSSLSMEQCSVISSTENYQKDFDVCSVSSDSKQKNTKTRRGLASKNILSKLRNLPKHKSCPSPSKKEILATEISTNEKVGVKSRTDRDLVVSDSDTEQPEQCEEENKNKFINRNRDVTLVTLSSPELISSGSNGKHLVCSRNRKLSSSAENSENVLKKQLARELFGDDIINSGEITIGQAASHGETFSEKKVTLVVDSSDEVEISFDLGINYDTKQNHSAQEQGMLVKNASFNSSGSVQCLNELQKVDAGCEHKNSLSCSPLTSSPLHGDANNSQDNLKKSAILVDSEDDDDCVRVIKKSKKPMIASDSDSSDHEANGMTSSFLSTQSETLTTQQRIALEGDLEKLHQEIAKYEAELNKQSSACLSQEKNRNKEQNSNDSKEMFSATVIDDSPVASEAEDKGKKPVPCDVVDSEMGEEDSNDLFLSPELSPTHKKDFPLTSGVKKTCLSQVKDHFLKQFQSPGGSVRTKKCLDFVKSDMVKESDLSNKSKSSKSTLMKYQPETRKSDSANKNLPTSPVLATQKKNLSAETKKKEIKPPTKIQKRTFYLMASGLNREDHLLLVKFCEMFGAVLHPKYTQEVSHVIMKPAAGFELVCDRTLKYFQAVAHKCWVLSLAWIVKSLEAKELLSEVEFEIEGDTSCGEKLNGAKRARMSKNLLFNNFCFACIGNSDEMSKGDLCDILQACGALIVDDPIALAAQPTKYKLIIRCSDGDNVPTPVELDMFNGLYKHMRLVTVMREWVLDSLGSYKIIPLADYVLNTADQVQVPF